MAASVPCSARPRSLAGSERWCGSFLDILHAGPTSASTILRESLREAVPRVPQLNAYDPRLVVEARRA
jgi:hypothetical protein